jgi:malate dehydrogenase (quinone)
LIQQVRQSPKDRINALKNMFQMRSKDWVLACRTKSSGYQRTKREGGILEFGTEVINTADGSLAVLLGASPSASNSSVYNG